MRSRLKAAKPQASKFLKDLEALVFALLHGNEPQPRGWGSFLSAMVG